MLLDVRFLYTYLDFRFEIMSNPMEVRGRLGSWNESWPYAQRTQTKGRKERTKEGTKERMVFQQNW